MSALDKLLDERNAEIARLGSLLDDAVDLLIAWLPAKDDPLLAEKTLHFLDNPTVARIVTKLADANWKSPDLIDSLESKGYIVIRPAGPSEAQLEKLALAGHGRVCPACGADYAEAEAKTRFKDFYGPDDEVHDGSHIKR